MALKTLQEFMNSISLGTKYGDGQCVALAKKYIREVVGGSGASIGNAEAYWNDFKNTYLTSCFTKHETPQAGDVFVMPWHKSAGHIGIVISVASGSMTVLEQNWPRGSGASKRSISLPNSAYRFLRPKQNVGSYSDSSSPTMKTKNLPTNVEKGKLFYVTQINDSTPYPKFNNPKYSDTISSGGCGVVAATIAINTLKQSNYTTKKEIAKAALEHGARKGNGTEENILFDYLKKTSKFKGLETTQYSTSHNLSKAKEFLRNFNGVVVLSVGAHSKYHFTSTGHYMCIFGYDGRNFWIADPTWGPRKYGYQKDKKGVLIVEPAALEAAFYDRSYYTVRFSDTPKRSYIDGAYYDDGESYESEDSILTISYQNWTGEVTIKKDFTNLLWYLDGTETPTDWGFRGMQGETMKLIGKIGNEYFYGRVYGICQSSILCVVPCNAVNGKGKKGKGTGTITIGGARLNSNGSETIDTSYTGHTKYNLTNAQIDDLAHICVREQGSGNLKAIAAEASIMANIFEYKRWAKATKYSDLYNYVLYGGWFGKNGGTINNPDYDPSKEELTTVKDVLVNGNRTIPLYVNEHDWISDIQYFNGEDTGLREGQSLKYRDSHTPNYLKNHSNYISGQTRIKNVFGSSWTFYTFFTDSKSADPFGYTDSWYKHVMTMAKKEEKKQSDTNSKGQTSDTPMKGREVPALFTTYDASGGIEGGDAYAWSGHGKPSSDIKNGVYACAAPIGVSFGTKIQVQGTGTKFDGRIYIVKDRGAAININNGRYDFDLLVPKVQGSDDIKAYGKAIIIE